MTSSTAEASNRGTSDMVAPKRTHTLSWLDEPEDVKQRQHHHHDIVVADAEQPTRRIGIHVQLEVRQLAPFGVPVVPDV